jgi:uncharacterized protein HemX
MPVTAEELDARAARIMRRLGIGVTALLVLVVAVAIAVGLLLVVALGNVDRNQTIKAQNEAIKDQNEAIVAAQADLEELVQSIEAATGPEAQARSADRLRTAIQNIECDQRQVVQDVMDRLVAAGVIPPSESIACPPAPGAPPTP